MLVNVQNTVLLVAESLGRVLLAELLDDGDGRLKKAGVGIITGFATVKKSTRILKSSFFLA